MGELRTSLRVRGEGMGVVLKTAVTFFVIFLTRQAAERDKYALAAFALGQFAYASTLFTVYTRYYGFQALKFIRQPGPMYVHLRATDSCLRLSAHFRL